MQPAIVRIKKIYQIDNYSFEVIWSDNKSQQFHLGTLQDLCPCAQCTEERTKGQKVKRVSDDVKAKKIYNVGRYGLRIDFTSGCSKGIYSYQFLYGCC